MMKFMKRSVRLVSGEWMLERREKQAADSEVQEGENDGLDKSGHSGGEDNSVA